MYHIVHVAPNQEQTPVIRKIQTVLEKFEQTYALTRTHKLHDLEELLEEQRFDLICLSTSFAPKELLDRLTLLAKAIAKRRSLSPLLYLVNFEKPLPCLFGTHWGDKVGILHNLSSEAEITATLQRLGELREVVDLLAYQSLRIRRKVAGREVDLQ
jgi:hypothetical protein